MGTRTSGQAASAAGSFLERAVLSQQYQSTIREYKVTNPMVSTIETITEHAGDS